MTRMPIELRIPVSFAVMNEVGHVAVTDLYNHRTVLWRPHKIESRALRPDFLCSFESDPNTLQIDFARVVVDIPASRGAKIIRTNFADVTKCAVSDNCHSCVEFVVRHEILEIDVPFFRGQRSIQLANGFERPWQSF